MLDAVNRSWMAASKKRAVTRPAGIEHERARMRNPVQPRHHRSPVVRRAVGVHLLVQEAVLPDGRRAFVGQQRKRDLPGGGERGERRGRVVGDDGQSEAAILKVRVAALQLHELRLAERSPTGRAAED